MKTTNLLVGRILVEVAHRISAEQRKGVALRQLIPQGLDADGCDCVSRLPEHVNHLAVAEHGGVVLRAQGKVVVGRRLLGLEVVDEGVDGRDGSIAGVGQLLSERPSGVLLRERRQVRERVLQALYAQEVSGDEAEHILATLIHPAFIDEPVYLRFAEKLFLRGLDVREDADALTSRHVQNWELARLALTDRLVIRMAVAELLYFEDIPPKVTLNEALEVAKTFSTEKSGSFVNGVLDAILRDLREADRLKKSGRGLVDMSTSPSSDD